MFDVPSDVPVFTLKLGTFSPFIMFFKLIMQWED